MPATSQVQLLTFTACFNAGQHRCSGLTVSGLDSDGRSDRYTRQREIKIYEDTEKFILSPFMFGENIQWWHWATGDLVIFLAIMVKKDIRTYNVCQIYSGFQNLQRHAKKYKDQNGRAWNQSTRDIWTYLFDGGLRKFIATPEDVHEGAADQVQKSTCHPPLFAPLTMLCLTMCTARLQRSEHPASLKISLQLIRQQADQDCVKYLDEFADAVREFLLATSADFMLSDSELGTEVSSDQVRQVFYHKQNSQHLSLPMLSSNALNDQIFIVAAQQLEVYLTQQLTERISALNTNLREQEELAQVGTTL
jgi:hypothetical protein